MCAYNYPISQTLTKLPVLRNKFSHTLTLFFLCTYLDQWPTFFTDFFTLIRPPESTSQITYNPHVSLLLFHIVLEISGEVADQLIKAARTFSDIRHGRDTRVFEQAPFLHGRVVLLRPRVRDGYAKSEGTVWAAERIWRRADVEEWEVLEAEFRCRREGEDGSGFGGRRRIIKHTQNLLLAFSHILQGVGHSA